MNSEIKAMRDVLIQRIYERMSKEKDIFFVAADLGAPKLDQLRIDFKDRFINVGIAEQNLINVSVGLALEGYTVFSYAIAAFLSMRAYEQIRNNISLLSKNKVLNINLVALGAGLSYDVSGPSHHCIEDIVLMRNLPNITFLSPADAPTAQRIADYSLEVKGPKYIRLDGKPLPAVYHDHKDLDIEQGCTELIAGKDLCLIATGYMTHTAMKAAELLAKDGFKAGVVDMFRLKPVAAEKLRQTLSKYNQVITLEEGFIGKGGLDTLVEVLLRGTDKMAGGVGFGDKYIFSVGNREHLHQINRLDARSVVERCRSLIKEGVFQ